MYYIVNHTEHIIAADKSLLDLLSVENVDELYTKIALGDLHFTRSNGTLTIPAESGESTYRTQEHILSGILGDITLVQINPSDEKPVFVLDNEYFDLLSDLGEEPEDTLAGIDLEDVQPLYFDFHMEKLANELSLPVALIREFIHDFIKQVHIETEKMLEAYEKDDLNSIQNSAHLLKSAASNLHITALSDPLDKIQFCGEISELEDLIKEYWGRFLSFEDQVNSQSGK